MDVNGDGFDDMVIGPVMQDLRLMFGGRDAWGERRKELVLPALRRAARELTPRTGESALCTKSSFRLWDTSEALPDAPSLYVGDGIHPSPAGAARLATAVAEKLRHCLRVCEYPGACAR